MKIKISIGISGQLPRDYRSIEVDTYREWEITDDEWRDMSQSDRDICIYEAALGYLVYDYEEVSQ